MDFNFPEKKGTGIERLIPHAEPECVELMQKLLKTLGASTGSFKPSSAQSPHGPVSRDCGEAYINQYGNVSRTKSQCV